MSEPALSGRLLETRRDFIGEPRVGHIHFLNVLPLTWSFAHGANRGLRLVPGVPAELNRALAAGNLDVSGISSIFYAEHDEELVILPDLCVRTDDKVTSILFVTKKPIEEFETERIILTAKSATSHCLLKIILSEAYGAHPNYYVRHIVPQNPVPDDAAGALFIGDDALWLYHHRHPSLHYYDLGEEWHKLTGLGMVYSLWVANRTFARERPHELQLVYERLLRGMDYGFANKYATLQSVLGEKDFSFEELEEYLEVICWDLKEEHLTGLELFYRMAHALNLVNHIPRLEFAKVKRLQPLGGNLYEQTAVD